MEGIQKIEDFKVSPLILEYPVGTKLNYKGALLNVTERKFLGCKGCFLGMVVSIAPKSLAVQASGKMARMSLI